MSPDQIADAARESIYALLIVSAPAMLVALAVGLIIALIQALTSIQEVTITFVPKIILVFVTLLLTMPLMASEMQQLTENLFAKMARVDTEPPGLMTPPTEPLN
jgi:flagellar biosynthesis protein FliQ